MAPTTQIPFLRRLPLAMVAAMLLWLLLRPAIDVTVAKLTQTLIRSFEYPKVTRLSSSDHRARSTVQTSGPIRQFRRFR